MEEILLIIFAYLLGSIPSGKLAGLYGGVDIQKKGSGNIGFANVRRVLGWRLALLVLVFDIAKGFIPVIIALKYTGNYFVADAAGCSSILGHVFPPWLKFKGGKGVATGIGVILALNPIVAMAGLAVYLFTIIIFKKAYLASLAAVWSFAIASLVIDKNMVVFCFSYAIFSTWTHRSNIIKGINATRHKYTST
jgi:glycerol-3-phosphate acyltransferase PlsY